MTPGLALFVVVAIIFVGLAIYGALGGRLGSRRDGDVEPVENRDPPPPPPPIAPVTDVAAIAAELEPAFEKMAHPGEALKNPLFERAVAALCAGATSVTDVKNYALGSNWVLQCIGFEALARRNDSGDVVARVRTRLANLWGYPLYFAIRFLEARSTLPEVGNIVVHAQYWWGDNPMLCEELDAVIAARLARGEPVLIGEHYDSLDAEARGYVHKFVAALSDASRRPIEAAIARHIESAVDTRFLRSAGELIGAGQLGDPVFETDQVTRLHDEIREELGGGKPRSVLIVGESGVGKSALRRLFGRSLIGAGWRIFKTSGATLVADKSYVGEIEGQVRKLCQNASAAKRVAVFVDRLDELDEFGRYKGKSSSLMDQLWPNIDSRDLFFVAETTPAGLQKLMKRFPTLPTVFKVVRMEPASEAATASMADRLLDLLAPATTAEQKDEVVVEALHLSQQFLSRKALPGSVLTLVELATIRAKRSEDGEPLGRTHVLEALSQVSGLPAEVLDERQELDVAAVRDAFTERVIGQDEAVDCLVERIAMLKAGLTDPSRPIGVFLFAGPTGTGKTEIAKTLAELLFGSAEQMIRLDMSEYQSPDSAWRLISDDSDRGLSRSLASRIREKPFSVVLLDEFEKAHAKVWDMFLQVFDDGRLTDVNGQLADFRHSIILLTSNLGSTINSEAGPGFMSTRGEFSAGDVMRSVNRTFRKEFINRLDRVVVFNPLGRDVMRAILRKELALALERRGLRSKQWAVEWEDSAVEFLLDEGFTPDLGARPLRRAIEKHLLAPLSMTMVQNQAPAGEQFLFVRSNGESLEVEFIDPDAGEVSEPTEEVSFEAGDLSVEQLLQSNASPAGAAAMLSDELAAIRERVEDSAWQKAKAELLAEMNGAGFWEDEDRHAVLDRIELIDRIESAASVLGRLSMRLGGSGSNPSLVRSIANRIFVLREGLKDLDERRATQAVIGVRLVSDDAELDGADTFRERLVEMYRGWARQRGMRLHEIERGPSRYEALFLVSGFGSYGLLVDEAGLHVLEVPAGDSRFDRIRARVEVAPVPAQGEPGKFRSGKAAGKLLDTNKKGKVVVVRRYREEPSPLARDSVRKWRTGRLDFVFEGNFDVIG